jgi:hypothetical protein
MFWKTEKMMAVIVATPCPFLPILRICGSGKGKRKPIILIDMLEHLPTAVEVRCFYMLATPFGEVKTAITEILPNPA